MCQNLFGANEKLQRELTEVDDHWQEKTTQHKNAYEVKVEDLDLSLEETMALLEEEQAENAELNDEIDHSGADKGRLRSEIKLLKHQVITLESGASNGFGGRRGNRRH